MHKRTASPVLVDARYLRAGGAAGEITGYLAIWGKPLERDAFNTWFDRQRPPDLGLGGQMENLQIRLLYDHGMAQPGRTIIGWIDRIDYDATGIAFHALLTQGTDYFDWVIEQIRRGELKVSSGSAEHLCSFDDEGRFQDWYISEVSLTPYPAEPNMPAVKLIRSLSASAGGAAGDRQRDGSADTEPGALHKSEPSQKLKGTRAMLTLAELGLDTNATLEDLIAALNDKLGAEAANALLQTLMGGAAEAPASEGEPEGETAMSNPPPGQRSLTIAEALAALTGNRAHSAAAQSGQPNDEQVRRVVRDVLMTMPPAPQPPPQRQRDAGQGQDVRLRVSDVRDLRFDSVPTRALAFAFNAMVSSQRPVLISDAFQRALAYKVAHEIEANAPIANDYTVRSFFPYRNRDDVSRSQFKAIRANELVHTGQANYGAEWVGVYYETDLWLTVRQAAVWQLLEGKGMNVRDIPRGYNTDVIPIESADPTWYKVGETTAVDATNRPAIGVTPSKEGTGKRELTVSKVGAYVPYSGEMDEDSLIPMAQELQRKMMISAQEQIEYMLLNGDTDLTASTNINKIDGTPGGTEVYTAMNGMLKNALVTTTANSRDGGALDVLDYRLLMGLLGTNGIAGNDPAFLTFIIDVPTYLATLDLAEVKTRDVSSFATVESGNITRIYGIDMLRSGQMALANTAGKISVTPGNNTKGRILLVRPDQWVMGRKRQVTMETGRDILADANYIVTWMRLGLQYRNSDAASAVSYNITV